MTRARAIACAAVLAATPAIAQQAEHRPPSTAPASGALVRPASHRLVWSDEFDRAGLPDPSRWDYDVERNRQGWANEELQYYSAARRQNARVARGMLTIEAHAERLEDRPDYGGQSYSSARLVTRGKADWRYGFFEVRAKIPCGRGIWPAIWMLGSDGRAGWPDRGEIDIMEHVGWDPGRVHGTVHTGAYNHGIGTQKGSNTLVPDACRGFHRYQLDWTADRIIVGVDGRAFMRFDNDHRGDPKTWPFSAPHWLLLNVAVGGWGGQKGIDRAAFPARMEVDYVRVWQAPE